MIGAVDAVLDKLVRGIEDWPKPGITFRDITPLLADPSALQITVDALADLGRDLADGPIDKVIGVEARGFIFGTPVALALGAGFVPVRKAGKLPAVTHAVSYDLEYGSETLEIHRDALAPGERVLVLDDVLATGGTMAAANELVTRSGAAVAADVVLIELAGLHGRDRLPGISLGALRAY